MELPKNKAVPKQRMSRFYLKTIDDETDRTTFWFNDKIYNLVEIVLTLLC